MSLLEAYQKYSGFSDKGTVHTYIQGYYSEEFKNPKRVKNFLELGIMHGGSIMLWHDWFTNARIEGVDVADDSLYYYDKNRGDEEYPRFYPLIMDAYQQATVDLFEDDFFDYIVDDGPHSVDSQCYAIEHYLCKVKPGGKLIIEDVQDGRDIEHFIKSIDKVSDLVADFKHIELNIKHRYDDRIFEITRA